MKNNSLKFLKGILLAIFSFSGFIGHAASVTATVCGTLPGCLPESSSLDFTGGSSFWTINDSGDKEIYKVSSTGAHTATINITNCAIRNWEGLAHDASRTYMYIGDFGNNANDRTNLRVFRIPYPSSIAGTSVAAEEIDFTYSDQTQIPAHWMNFDAEAFFHFNGDLYIFTKADGNAIGYTKMYRLSDSPGSHVAQLVDSFYTNDRTTSADISPDGSSMILISNTHIHLFRNYSGSDFFGGQHTQINIAGGWTQKEGVSFSSGNEIFLSDEGSPGRLYYVDLSNWIPATPVYTSIEKINEASANVYPIPANQFVNISVKNLVSDKLSFSLFDLTGKLIYEAKIENTSTPFLISTADFPSGIYFYRIYADAKEVQTERLVVSH